MKPLREGGDPSLAALTELVQSARPHVPNPFAKRLVQARLTRAIGLVSVRSVRRPVWVLGAGLLLAASAAAAAASYSLWSAPAVMPSPAVVSTAQPTTPPSMAAPAPPATQSAAPLREMSPDKPRERRADKPRAGEDPSQVAEAVRALRKQGDAARAQSLLDRYLRENPRGALSEDALALSIEAAVARKDPRAAEYARRYLARYPQGRFRGLAERVLSR